MGPERSRVVRNHVSAVDNPQVVSRMLAKELAKSRIAGPFVNPPLPNFQTSTIGLVPKKDPGSFQLIHNLSFPRQDSINSEIPSQYSSVQYESLDQFSAFRCRGKIVLLQNAISNVLFVLFRCIHQRLIVGVLLGRKILFRHVSAYGTFNFM
jgi:hypothetical protein